jgi:hypothetical protein
VRIVKEIVGSEWWLVGEAMKESGQKRYPPPRVFFVRVANKGVMLDAASRMATAGLEVVLFSASGSVDILVVRRCLNR